MSFLNGLVGRVNRRLALTVVVIVGLVVWPAFAPFSLLGDAIQAGIITIVAVSLVLLIGWVGQISLAQATFVGIGSFGCALVIRGTGLPFPLNHMPAADERDWDAVEEWAEELAERFQPKLAPA